MKQKFSRKNSEKKTRISRKLFLFNQLTIISQTKKLSVILFPCDKYIKWNFLFMLSPSFIIFCQMLWNLCDTSRIFLILLFSLNYFLLSKCIYFLSWQRSFTPGCFKAKDSPNCVSFSWQKGDLLKIENLAQMTIYFK